MALTGHSFTRCLTSLLHLKLGADADPAVFIPVKHLQMWCDSFANATKGERSRLARAWRIERDRLRPLNRSQRWANVSGPVSATLAYLFEVA